MSGDPAPPAASPGATAAMPFNDKGDLRVAGAGTLGMYILLSSLSMLFAASLVAYGYVRWVHFHNLPWPPAGFPHLPATLWASTAVIFASSFTIQYALSGIRQGNQRALRIGLALTLLAGFSFLLLQGYNWWEIYRQLSAQQLKSQYVKLFYVLTGLHAAHVIGGLIPLALVTGAAFARVYSPNYHPGVRYTAIYWHFLDVVWAILFVMIYLV